MYKKFCSVISFILFGIMLSIGIFPITSYADSARVPVTVKVGYYENEVFEDGASDDAVKKGYAYEYYRKISEYTGWNYEYVYGDFVTIYQMLLDGEVDLVAGLAYTDERSRLISFPEKPMGFEKYGIVKHDDDPNITKDVRTLQSKTIGVLDSAIVDVLEKFLEKKHVEATIITFKDYDELLSCFDRKELDAIAAELDGIYERNHATVLYSFGETDYYLCVNKKRPLLLEALNEAQSQLLNDNPDYISYLRDKYFSSALASRALTTSEYEWIGDHDTLHIGYLNNFLPYSDSDANGQPTGIVSEVFPNLFGALGVSSLSYNYVAFDNYDKMMEAIRSGEIDVAFPAGGGLFYSEVDGLLITDPVISTLTDLVYKAEAFDDKIADFAINKNNKLQFYYIKNNYPDATIRLYNTSEECLKAVADREASYTALNGLRTDMLMKKAGSDLSFIQLSFKDDICFGVKIGNDGLLKLLNRGIKVMGQDYAQNLAFRYSQNLNSFSFADYIRRHYWLMSLIMFLIFLVIITILYRNIKANKRRIREKELAQEEIEKANHEKFVFVNKMANYMGEPVRKLALVIDKSRENYNPDRYFDELEEMDSYVKELNGTINNILNMSRLESGQLQIEDRQSSRDFSGRRLLVVEDSLQNKMITGKILKRFGFEIQVADDANEACAKLMAAPEKYFDALLLDVEFNEKDAYNAVSSIRSMNNENKAAIPIIAITSGEVHEGDKTFEEVGFSAAISKPYDLYKIESILTEVFN